MNDLKTNIKVEIEVDTLDLLSTIVNTLITNRIFDLKIKEDSKLTTTEEGYRKWKYFYVVKFSTSSYEIVEQIKTHIY